MEVQDLRAIDALEVLDQLVLRGFAGLDELQVDLFLRLWGQAMSNTATWNPLSGSAKSKAFSPRARPCATLIRLARQLGILFMANAMPERKRG
jgi:hypothetical protein